MERLIIVGQSSRLPILELRNENGEIVVLGHSELGASLLKSHGSLEAIYTAINQHSKRFEAELFKGEPDEMTEADLEPQGEGHTDAPTAPEGEGEAASAPINPDAIVTEDVNQRIAPALAIIKEIIQQANAKREEEAQIEAQKETAALEQQNAQIQEPIPSQLYVSYDGDSIGNAVARAEEQDDETTMKEISERIQSGQVMAANWANQFGGKVIQAGGDEGLVKVPNTALDHLEEFRDSYKASVGATVTVGVGSSISESTKARMLGKLRGKNQVCIYDDQTEQELKARATEDETESSTQHKLKAGGLLDVVQGAEEKKEPDPAV